MGSSSSTIELHPRVLNVDDYITPIFAFLGQKIRTRLRRRAFGAGSPYNIAPLAHVVLRPDSDRPMKIIVNGEEKNLDHPMTVSQLLADMGVADKRVAVEVNLEIVPRSEHNQFQLNNADRVEVVQAIGGG